MLCNIIKARSILGKNDQSKEYKNQIYYTFLFLNQSYL